MSFLAPYRRGLLVLMGSRVKRGMTLFGGGVTLLWGGMTYIEQRVTGFM